MLIIDSRAREPGGSLDGFQIRIAPAIEGIRGVSLLYASIANPDALLGHPYTGIWLANPQRGELGQRNVYCAGQLGFRTLHRAESDFSRIEIQTPATPIYSLTVEVSLPGGQRPGSSSEWLMLVGLHY